MNRFGMRPRSTAGVALALALAASGSIIGCARHDERAASDRRPPVRVAVTVVRGGAAGGDLTLPGRVEAREEVTLASRIAGRVTSLRVAEGAAFHEGDLLVRFDAPEAREALVASEAGHAAARSRLALARRQEARYESLYASKVAALHELEVVRAEREAAEAAERGASALAAERRSAVEIRAPFAGVLVRRHVDPGAEVGPGAPLLDLRSRESGLVVVAIPEQAAALARGAAALQIGEGPWRDARLVRVDGMIDPISRTRTARYRPADRGGAPLEAGAFARVRIGAARDVGGARSGSDAGAGAEVEVPSRALVHRGALAGVYVLRDGRASLRWLRLGRIAGDRAAVLAGLDPGDSVA
ncbi:MAG TPA: efflux RND transporter periplasmic adaptor subunit, partial [Candidatus Eisenbacteria bacterium]|nr:efflux RND transporter periplasmic adaptor subunit [Candidatus Eisenbacteria bacterium]